MKINEYNYKQLLKFKYDHKFHSFEVHRHTHITVITLRHYGNYVTDEVHYPRNYRNGNYGVITVMARNCA